MGTTSLQDRIVSDTQNALRGKDALRLETLRLLSAAIHNREIEKRAKSGDREFSDEEVLEVVQREAKKRKEAAELYTKGGRGDLAQKELSEFAILKAYLPDEASQEEIRAIVAEAIKKTGALGANDFGRVMGEVMKKLKGRADGAAVGASIRSQLS